MEVVEHDLERPLPALGLFDVVAASIAIHHLPHHRKRELYQEVWVALEPGGVFCNLEHVASPSARVHERFRDALGITPAEEDQSNKLLDMETQLGWLREIGFEDVDCYWKWRELALLVGRMRTVIRQDKLTRAPPVHITAGDHPMTEAEWLASTDPRPMLAMLDGRAVVRRPRFFGWLSRSPAAATASDRKLRLFACGCCQRSWTLMRDPLCRRAVEVAEQFADGLATDQDMAAAKLAVTDTERPAEYGPASLEARRTGRAVTLANAPAAARGAMDGEYSEACRAQAWGGEQDAPDHTERVGLNSLRDIFGSLPFRPVPLDPAWLAWNHGTVPAIARHVSDDRAFHDLPILADALENAGCTDPDMLGHCRSRGPHVRGCWVVDLLLGKG